MTVATRFPWPMRAAICTAASTTAPPLERLRNKGHADSLHLVGTPLPPLQYGALGLDGYRKNARVLFLEKARDAREGASGPDTGDEGIDPALHLFPEFLGCGGMVEVRIRGVFELESG